MRKIHIFNGFVMGVSVILLCISYIAHFALDGAHIGVVITGLLIAALHFIGFYRVSHRQNGDTKEDEDQVRDDNKMVRIIEKVHIISGAMLALTALMGFMLVAFASALLGDGLNSPLPLSTLITWIGTISVPVNIVSGMCGLFSKK